MNKYVKEAMRMPFESEAVAEGIVTYCSRMSINDKSNFDTTELILAKAFRASFYTARTRDEWVRIANALDHDYLERMGEKRVRTAFNRMSRAGLIRSRRASGKNLVELNLNWGMK